ncbi:MAG TPA: endolytic transglycosylase MltG [Cyclobacteriaceae bacterium]|nr:endolytic transglycosylase MltG [Cyclobacteriaceae bacterium]
MKPEVNKVKLVLYIVASTLLITFVFYGYQICYTPNILLEREDQVFIIRPGTTFSQIQEELGNQSFVNDMVSFSFLAKLTNYDKTIKPGRFLFRRNMSNLQALNVLKFSQQVPVRITFSYVRLRNEMVEKITKNIGLSGDEFNHAMDEFIRTNDQGFNKDNILCMFLPNTYEVYFTVSAEDLVNKFNAEYKKFWNEDRISKAKSTGLSPIDVSILASIVQAESVKPDEAPVIAGLYLNRLKKKIALQADPTLVFAVGDFGLKRVLNSHKEIDSPYNTYKYPGLPPGPINVPQLASIDAVLNYQPNDYYYMCAKEDFSGYHNFAHNLDDHNRNARKYQRALNAEIEKAKQNRK